MSGRSDLAPAFGLREAGVLDATLLAALHAACFAQAWTAETFVEMLSLPGRSALIAHHDQEPFAFVLMQVIAPDAEIHSLGVIPAQRRQGIARRLITLSLDRIAVAGGRHVFLEVSEKNDPARAVYAQAGFRIVGRREAYYRLPDGSAEAALVMRRDLFA